METALSSGADKEEPACDDASSIEIAAHTLDLQGFLQASLQGSFHYRFTRPLLSPRIIRQNRRQQKRACTESCLKRRHGDKLAPVALGLSW
jgi:hypothetical protein